MGNEELLRLIAKGRTDLIFEVLSKPDWEGLLMLDRINVIQWLVYYNDLTALKAVELKGFDFSKINLNSELGNAAFFGHWKMCEFLIKKGAEVNAEIDQTGETPLHNALSKAGRPYYINTVRILLENGANPNKKTKNGIETGAFMRDVRTRGETSLHRAAAFANPETIQLLLDYEADKTLKDAHGDTPLSWASWHLRPGSVLQLLSYGSYQISDKHTELNRSDHGNGWGNSMDWNLFGDYLPLKDR